MKNQLPHIFQAIITGLAGLFLPCGLLLAAALSCSSPPNNIIDTGKACVNTASANMQSFSSVPFSALTAHTTDLNRLLLAERLGWVSVQGSHTQCGGYFIEPAIAGSNLKLPPISTTQTTVTADNGLGHLNNGISTLSGNLVITQPGRIVTADTGQMYAKNGAYTDLYINGHVTLREEGKLVDADRGHINLQDKSAQLYDVIYRMFLPRANEPNVPIAGMPVVTAANALNAWGSASVATQSPDKIMHFKQITYSTCPPGSRFWLLEAAQMELNHLTGRGVARNATLYTNGIPVLYVPYFNFPIDNRRQTGFLFPTYSSSSYSGIGIGVPYYWNIAPNYDDTVTPKLYVKSGFELSNLFRYLTPSSKGQFSFSFLPDDRGFADFQKDTPSQYTTYFPVDNIPINITPETYRNQISSLENDSTARSYISWQDSSVINDNWSYSVNYSRASDDYYLEDFGATPSEVVTNQLLQQGQLNYTDDTWNFLVNLQSYQTLHPINQAATINQYNSLPQLLLTTRLPTQDNQLNYELSSELVDFTNTPNPGQLTTITGANGRPLSASIPQGARFNLQPGIFLPLTTASGFITPQAQFELTQYSLYGQPTGVQPFGYLYGQPVNFANNITRALPIFNIDSGLYFDRNVDLFGNDYVQTLEPRLYYLYIPYHDQDDIPLFDSAIQPFTYDQLFRTNRYSGTDRIGDANQISLGLSSSIWDQATGIQKIQAGIGAIYYFSTRRVTLCQTEGCVDEAIANNGIGPFLTTNAPSLGSTSPTEQVSPIVGQLTYNFNQFWNATANLAWDAHSHLTQNGSLNIGYIPLPNHVINLNYNFLRYGDILSIPPTLNSPVVNGVAQENLSPTSTQNDMSQPGFSFVWPIHEQWQMVGSWNYNLSHKHPQTYFYGVEYDSCCWAVRLVSAHTFNSLNSVGAPQFNNTLYLQFQLKGLGNIGSNDPTSLLLSTIPGYQENFGML